MNDIDASIQQHPLQGQSNKYDQSNKSHVMLNVEDYDDLT
jgi:hypothetical protein